MNKLYLLLTFALLFGTKAFAQEWEHSHRCSYSSDTTWYAYYEAKELSDGSVAASSCFSYRSGAGDFYSSQPAISKFSSSGEEIAQKCFFKPGYCTTSAAPYLFEDDKGDFYALMTYNPDHDSTYFNHFLHYDNPPCDAILGLYKLDDDLSIIESYEYSMPIDTFENRGEAIWDLWPNELSGNLFLFSAFVDEQNIVGAYFKTVSYDYYNPRGNDSLFLFKMNFKGEILEQKGYDRGVSGANHQNNERRNHIIQTDSSYIYYFGDIFGGTEYQGVAYYYDKNLNFQRKRFLKHPGLPNYNSFTNVSVKRSRHNTTYLCASSEVQGSYSDRNIRLYELDDDADNASEMIPIVRYLERGTSEYDIPSYMQSVDIADDNSILFAYALNIGFNFNLDSWLMIEHLDLNFDTISTVFYGVEGDRVHSWARNIQATKDGGALLVSDSRDLNDPYQYWYTITKFPAEAFLSVDEAHANGLKLAIAYPNPGGNEMHIRTAVENAAVEVYDMNGRLVAQQPVTETETVLDATDWASGEYVWKVVSGVSTLRQSSANAGSTTLVETGKWVKE